ncbi:MAG: hypothetical protein FGM55_14765, partial [Rhodoferax sp.]|nr:hypothetical protein [Rhodoferax sp.]
MGAHGARHRIGLRGAHPVPRSPARAGLRAAQPRPGVGRLLTREPPAVAELPDPAAVRDRFRTRKAELLTALDDTTTPLRSVRSLLGRLSALVDETLTALWQGAGLDSPLTLVAVGGFGRGELFPGSDVDVLLLLPQDQSADQDPQLKARIETFISQCWDAGLEIGSSVRNLRECLEEAAADVTVQTSLLEARRVTGSLPLFRRFQTDFFQALDPRAFFTAKRLEMEQRHQRFENTPYALEPNCKESPGGLRDLQTILWVARAAGFGANWDALARKGLATPFEVRQLKRNEALLRLIRAQLHRVSRRREDRLVFDLQTAVAERFGYQLPAHPDETGAGIARPVMRPSEMLMRRYYWAAKAVTQLNQILLLN